MSAQRLLAVLLASLCAALSAWAQMTPVGTWQSVGDETGQPKAQIVISEHDGALTGRIEKLLREGADPNEVCDRCTDDRKGQRLIGMEIIRGGKKAQDGDPEHPVWQGGRILDPEKGSTYALRLTPVDGGQKLEVRGSIGPFGRTQTWLRVRPEPAR